MQPWLLFNHFCVYLQDLIHLILIALATLCNCLQVPTNVAYCMNTKCDSIVQCFITSTHPLIHLFTVIVLAYLERKLTTGECRNYCILKSSDVKTMLDLLTQPNNLYLSIVSLLKALQVLLNVDKDNTAQFLSAGILSTLSDILLASNESMIMNEVLMTCWMIAVDPTGLTHIKAHSKLIQSLESLKGYDDHNIALILNCILWDIAGSQGNIV